MTKLFLLAVFLGPSAFAAEMTEADAPEFERGYIAGVESCNQNSFWKCTLSDGFFERCGQRFVGNGHAYATGPSKAIALGKLVAAWGGKPECQEMILMPRAVTCVDVLSDSFNRVSGPRR